MPASIYDPARTLLVTVTEVRDFAGLTSNADAGDTAIQGQIRYAQALIVGSLAEHVINLQLEGSIDGDNATFEVPRDRRARVLFDDNLDAAATGDVLVQSRTDSEDGNPPTYATLTVTSMDAVNGILVLNAAPGTTVDAILFTGRLTTRRLDKEALKTAILAQTALLLDARIREPGKVNLANAEAQKKNSGDGGRGRRMIWEDVLASAMRRLRRLVPGKAGVDTRLRRGSVTADGGNLDP